MAEVKITSPLASPTNSNTGAVVKVSTPSSEKVKPKLNNEQQATDSNISTSVGFARAGSNPAGVVFFAP